MIKKLSIELLVDKLYCFKYLSEVNNVYYRLMAIRKREKITQSELAKKLNIHRVTYGLKERQEMDFTISEAKLLGEELGVPWNELFEEEM